MLTRVYSQSQGHIDGPLDEMTLKFDLKRDGNVHTSILIHTHNNNITLRTHTHILYGQTTEMIFT